MKTFTFSTEQDSEEVESAHKINYKIILFSIEVAGHKQMIQKKNLSLSSLNFKKFVFCQCKFYSSL